MELDPAVDDAGPLPLSLPPSLWASSLALFLSIQQFSIYKVTTVLRHKLTWVFNKLSIIIVAECVVPGTSDAEDNSEDQEVQQPAWRSGKTAELHKCLTFSSLFQHKYIIL